MTLLILIISITNIALGYGLAIYLGHARAGAALTVRAARSKKAAEQSAVAENWQEPPLAPPPVEEPVVQAVAPEPVVAAPAPPLAQEVPPPPVAPEPVVLAVETPPVEAAPVQEETAVEEEVLNKLEEVRAEIHEMPAPATMVDALAETAEAATAEPIPDDPSKPVSKEALLESINAFQAQLKKQQELAKLHAVTSKS